MELLGIRFAPLNTPLHRRIQTLAAFVLLFLAPITSTLGIFLSVYILFYTKYWIIVVIYLFWIWVIDKDTPERGARRNETFCSFNIQKYAKDYFPANLILEEGLKLDARRNYLLCTFPHGVLPIGTYLTIVTNYANFNKFFPHHQVNSLTLNINFKFPLLRDLILLLGSCSVSAKSINYLLSYPGGGRIASLSVGGAEESIYARPGPYYIVLKKRKGFIKLALKNGSPLIPVFSFGEIELFDQVGNSEGSLWRSFQHWFKQKSNFAPLILLGRGFLQYSFGLVPRRTPLNVVVGTPIEVEKNENPTQLDIDTLHLKFIEELERLFNKYKHQFVVNPKHAKLIIY